MAKPKRINGKALFICLLVCITAAGVFLIGFLNRPSARLNRSASPKSTISAITPSAQQTSNIASASATPASLPPFNLSVWVAYWDGERGINDLNAIAGMPDSLQVFAASFNSNDDLFFTDDMAALVDALKPVISTHPDLPVYITLVNDLQNKNGEWSEKDSGLIDRLLQSETSRAEHLSQIIDIVDKYGFDGVEVDYEKISGRAWNDFADFSSQLYNELKSKGKALRVVLEPSWPVSAANLPPGPEYVIMAYNLYGQGTGPGPKADSNFIRELADRMNALPGDKSIAFATGGYDWSASGDVQELTESDAYNLSKNSNDIQRDSQSGALHFTYQANDGVHTVWYADGEALAGWFNLSRSLGYGNVALWRLGGERIETLQMLSQLEQLSIKK